MVVHPTPSVIRNRAVTHWLCSTPYLTHRGVLVSNWGLASIEWLLVALYLRMCFAHLMELHHEVQENSCPKSSPPYNAYCVILLVRMEL